MESVGIWGSMRKELGGCPGNIREILLLPFARIGFVGRTRGAKFWRKLSPYFISVHPNLYLIWLVSKHRMGAD